MDGDKDSLLLDVGFSFLITVKLIRDNLKVVIAVKLSLRISSNLLSCVPLILSPFCFSEVVSFVPTTLMGPSRSSSLHIGGDSSAVSGSGRTGGASDRFAGVDLRDAPGEPPLPLNKG